MTTALDPALSEKAAMVGKRPTPVKLTDSEQLPRLSRDRARAETRASWLIHTRARG